MQAFTARNEYKVIDIWGVAHANQGHREYPYLTPQGLRSVTIFAMGGASKLRSFIQVKTGF